jgi:hypothetical protein
MPETKVLLIGPLPTGLHPNSSNRIKYDMVHSLIKNYASPKVSYLPLTKYFIKQDGELDTNYCSGDGTPVLKRKKLKDIIGPTPLAKQKKS